MTSGHQSTLSLHGVVSFTHQLVAQAIPFCISTLLVCIVESWLSANIPNLDITLPNYLSFRHDGNWLGGGIVVFAKSHFIASKVYVSPKLNFFFYPLSLIIFPFQLALTTSLHSHLTIWIFCFDKLTSLNPSILSNLIILGDFNINFFSTSSSKTKLDVTSDTFDLKQIVNAPTHFSHTDTPSTIDLVFLPSNIDSSSCSILSPVSFSGNFSILLSLPTDYVNSPSPFPPCKVWLYHLD